MGLCVQEFPADAVTGEAGEAVKASTAPNDKSNKGTWNSEVCLTFPWMCAIADLSAVERKAYDLLPEESRRPNGLSVILRTKARALSTKGKQRVLPKGGGWGFFGWHLVKPEHAEVVVTEGEFDAMAVHQYLQRQPLDEPLRSLPVVSLPNGCNSLPPELVAKLERFTKIYLWLDNDVSHILSIVHLEHLLIVYAALSRPLVRPQRSSSPRSWASPAVLRCDHSPALLSHPRTPTRLW
jgi:hypothetical protein